MAGRPLSAMIAFRALRSPASVTPDERSVAEGLVRYDLVAMMDAIVGANEREHAKALGTAP